MNGLSSAGLRAGPAGTETALVFGAGRSDCCSRFPSRPKSVSLVTVADINEGADCLAERLGLETAVSGSQALAGRRHDFDFVADATGIARIVEGMIDFVADGGTVLVFGVCAPDQRISIAPFEIFRRQIRFAGSHSLNRNIPEALAILKRDTGAMAQLVSHRLPLDDVLPFITKRSSDPATMKVQFSVD